MGYDANIKSSRRIHVKKRKVIIASTFIGLALASSFAVSFLRRPEDSPTASMNDYERVEGSNLRKNHPEEKVHKCEEIPACGRRNWKWTDPCTFYRKGTGPIPVILMALGRSGSSITWSTMSTLSGERNFAYERTGQTQEITERFFQCLEQCPFSFHNWTIQALCHIQQRRPDITIKSGIAGFQWKP